MSQHDNTKPTAGRSAFKARGISCPINEKNCQPKRQTVDGVAFGTRHDPYPGVPTEAMLASPLLDITDMKGRAYPGSVSDKLQAAPPERAKRITADGSEVLMAGPGSQLDLKRRGLWPDAEEKALQAFVAAKLQDPIGVGARLIQEREGCTPEVARARAVTRSQKGRASRIPVVG